MTTATATPESPTAAAASHLFTDDEMASFVIDGYTILQPRLRDGIDAEIYAALDALDTNPGDALLEVVPQLREVWDAPEVVGALTSLLGADYAMFPHRHCHRNSPGTPSQQIHQDNLNDFTREGGQVREPENIEMVLAMYYPQDVADDMGPTLLLPGTHVLQSAPERMASQGNFRDQVIATVPAGSVVILHYDIWHCGTANTSDQVRYMLKFLFQRQSPPTSAAWAHDAANDARIQRRLETDTPMAMHRTLAAKQRYNRTSMWNNLAGVDALQPVYQDKWAGGKWR